MMHATTKSSQQSPLVRCPCIVASFNDSDEMDLKVDDKEEDNKIDRVVNVTPIL
jgi:hypothetical protein